MSPRLARSGKTMIPPGLEPGTACVLDRSDNHWDELVHVDDHYIVLANSHYTTEPVMLDFHDHYSN